MVGAKSCKRMHVGVGLCTHDALNQEDMNACIIPFAFVRVNAVWTVASVNNIEASMNTCMHVCMSRIYECRYVFSQTGSWEGLAGSVHRNE